MPRENFPAAFFATAVSPTISSTSSTRVVGILFDAAMNRR